MDLKSKSQSESAPLYQTIETYCELDDDIPGPRCSHTLTAVPATSSHGPRLILFGGATTIEGGSSFTPGIRLAGVTNAVHCYDVVTRKWTRIHASGESPSPRAAHAAAAFGNMVVLQGGIAPAGHSSDDLYVLDLTSDDFKWHRVVVQGEGPGPRYGHVMDLVAQRYLVIFGGNDGQRVLAEAWALDTARKPYTWERLNPEGDRPSARMYATASARSDGMLLLCGGRDSFGAPQEDAYGLLLHQNGQWEWTLAPGISPSPRYQHAAAFVGARLHVIGGALRGGRLVEGGDAVISVLDTAAGNWLDRNGLVTTLPTKTGHAYDPSLEIMRRCRHAAAAVGVHVFIFGGLKGDMLLNDFLMAENAPNQFDAAFPILTSGNASTSSSPEVNQSNANAPVEDGGPDFLSPSGIGMRMDIHSIDRLRKASAAEAEATSSVWQDMNAVSECPIEEISVSDDNSRAAETTSDGSDSEGEVHLHPRAVVVAKEAVGNLGGMVRQVSLDQFQNESRRVAPATSDSPYPLKRFIRPKSPQGLHKKIISTLLRPQNWKAPTNRQFFLDTSEVGELCHAAEQIFMREPTILQLKAPIKVFGDLHGQFGDLMRLFDAYGFPFTEGDITYIDYLFLGDYVDRGQHSLETIALLLALKIEYPDNVHLIRGNHEAADVNALFGFRIECIERMGETAGIWAWKRFNQLFNYLPLAALIERKIICMHGGIGKSISSLEQIEKVERPITMDSGSEILMDLLWSDPTENDTVEGLRPNARGPGLVTFGHDRVTEFCKNNRLQLIIRAHECVMDGFERFAQGQLITLFSATNYCGLANNAGAILVIGRGLVLVPKLIHPLPPPFLAPESSPGRLIEETWMQELNTERPPTPPRGRPQPAHDRGSLAYI